MTCNAACQQQQEALKLGFIQTEELENLPVCNEYLEADQDSMKAQDRSAACAVVAEHASGQSGHQPKHDSSSAHEGQVAEVQGGHDAHGMAGYGCQQPDEQSELHNSSFANDEQLTKSQGGDGEHVAAEHGSKPSEEHAGLHSSSAASKQMAQAQDGSAAPDVAEHTSDAPQGEPVLHNSRSANGDRVWRAEKDTAKLAVAEHGNKEVEEQHELHINSLAQKQQVIMEQDSDAAHVDAEHHCKESEEQLTLQSSPAALEQRAALPQGSDVASSAAHVEFEDEHRLCRSEGPPKLQSSIPAQTSAPVQSIPALTEIQTAEHHASHAQHRAELNGVESALDGSGSVQHSNCATSPRCNGSQPPQHEDTAGPPGESGGCHQQCEGRSAATRCLQQKPGTLAGCSRSPCDCSFSCAAPKQHSGPVGLPSLLREGKQCMERARGSDA